MPHVVQTNENANKFKTIEKAPSPTPPPQKKTILRVHLQFAKK